MAQQFACPKTEKEFKTIQDELFRITKEAIETLDEVNKVKHLATVCQDCHKAIHSPEDYSSELPKEIWDSVIKYRKMLQKSE